MITFNAVTFSDIFKSSFLQNITEFSILDTVIGMAFSLVVGLFVFLIYKKTFNEIMYSTGFAMTLVGLSLVTTLVIMAVTSNVVLSLGMVGALSILNIQKTNFVASGPTTSWEIDGETVEMVTDFIFLGSKITAEGD